jgi:hypothetical protein
MLYAILCYNSEETVFAWSKDHQAAVILKASRTRMAISGKLSGWIRAQYSGRHDRAKTTSSGAAIRLGRRDDVGLVRFKLSPPRSRRSCASLSPVPTPSRNAIDRRRQDALYDKFAMNGEARERGSNF